MQKQPNLKICPLLSINSEKPNTYCLRNGCMWFYPKQTGLNNPDECVVASISRNLLDIRIRIEEFKNFSFPIDHHVDHQGLPSPDNWEEK